MEQEKALFERAVEFWKMLALSEEEFLLMTPETYKQEAIKLIELPKTEAQAG